MRRSDRLGNLAEAIRRLELENERRKYEVRYLRYQLIQAGALEAEVQQNVPPVPPVPYIPPSRVL